MSGLFISYRRSDAAGHAATLRSALAERYGRDQVFIDIESLAPGAAFGQQLNETVKSCSWMLVVIGPRWLSASDAQGHRRIDDPDDWIRNEIATALRLGKVVVPVLVDGAHLPSSNELPVDIRDLARRQAFEIRVDRFERDISGLFLVLDPLLGQPTWWNRLFGKRVATGSASTGTPPHRAPSPDYDRTTRSDAVAPVGSHSAPTDSVEHVVFVSYAKDDRALADKVVAVLERNGRACWIAHRNIPAGNQSWAGAIVEAIANSRIVIVVVTAKSIASKQVLREVTLADNESIPLLPLCLDRAPLSKDLKYFFASAQRLEAASIPWEQAVQVLNQAVENHLMARNSPTSGSQ